MLDQVRHDTGTYDSRIVEIKLIFLENLTLPEGSIIHGSPKTIKRNRREFGAILSKPGLGVTVVVSKLDEFTVARQESQLS
tara:strand:+ start:44 stop:286 length:243 start_codon:yes stop_codon:yes gene_type:complete